MSVDNPENAAKMRASAEVDFDVLSDPDGKVIDLLGLRHGGAGPGGSDIAQSASFLLDDEGRVVWQRIAENYRVRPKPEEILDAFDRELSAS